MQRESIVERVAQDTGPYFHQALQQLAQHPLVGEVRSIGLLGALELVADKRRRRFFSKRGEAGSRCRDFALANGLILRATKDTMLFSPPLIMDSTHIDDMLALTRLSLDQTAVSLGIC
jgi:putrescine aminotransferase